MKILVGICGIGHGHCARQFQIIRELEKNGHEIRILTYGNGVTFFENYDIKVYKVFVPFVMFKNGRIDFFNYIKKNNIKILTGYFQNKKIFKELKKENFIPDICISDYEPIVASFSYKLNIPLINIDQQSKFIYIEADKINGFSIFEEKNRMKLFFPKCDQKLIISFYKIDKKLLPSNVKILPPIIREEIKQYNCLCKNKNIVVYFSKFIDTSIKQDIADILEIFSKFSDYKFNIFTSENFEKYDKEYNNIEFKKNNDKNFAKDLGSACCVISTAGHTLISEAFYCNIPIFVIPLPTFDQNYCAKFVNDNKIGFSSDVITYDNLKKFINNIDEYIKNIKTCENLVKGEDSIKKIIKEINKYENNNKCR